MIRILATHKYDSAVTHKYDSAVTHKYDSAVTLCRQYIARDSQVTRVKYNQYTSCRLKVLAKWLKICRVMIKRVLIFLEGIVCKHLLVWGPSFVNLLSLSEIYTRKVVAHDLQVQIKIAIENSLLSKLSYETILSFLYTKSFILQQFLIEALFQHISVKFVTRMSYVPYTNIPFSH